MIEIGRKQFIVPDRKNRNNIDTHENFKGKK